MLGILTYCDTEHKGNLRRPVTLTLIAERLAVELSLPVFTTLVCPGWDLKTQPSDFKANALAHWATEVMTCLSGFYYTSLYSILIFIFAHNLKYMLYLILITCKVISNGNKEK